MPDSRADSGDHAAVDWSAIQTDLHNALCDTLIILNCCFAGNASLGPPKGTNEILAASDRESVAWVLDRSFLKALAEVLLDLAPSKFTINKLRDRLDEYNKFERGAQRIACPFHRRFPSLDHPSIMLQPMSKSKHGPRQATELTQAPSSPTFYLKLSLDSPENISTQEWISCFSNANYPSDVKLHFYTEESLKVNLSAHDGKQHQGGSVK